MDVLHEATEMVETVITFYTDIIVPVGTHLQPKPYNDWAANQPIFCCKAGINVMFVDSLLRKTLEICIF